MTFAEVIPMLLQGKKINRAGWTSAKYLDIFHGAVMDNIRFAELPGGPDHNLSRIRELLVELWGEQK